jgi:hypothetical protein
MIKQHNIYSTTPMGSHRVLEQEIEFKKGQAVDEQTIEQFGSFFSVSGIEVLTYTQLANYSSFFDLFQKHPKIVLHFPQGRTGSMGHYVAIWLDKNNNFMFFCPYGFSIDKNLRYATFLHLNPQYRHLLPNLINKHLSSGYRVLVNPYKFQELTNDIATCSYHCVVRLKNKDKNHDEYKKYLYFKGINLDDLVTLLCYYMEKN